MTKKPSESPSVKSDRDHWRFDIFVITVATICAFVAGWFMPFNILGVFGFVLIASLVGCICGLVAIFVKRLAVTTGLLFAMATSLGLMQAFEWGHTLRGPGSMTLRLFVFFVAWCGGASLMVTAPLTLHRWNTRHAKPPGLTTACPTVQQKRKRG